MLTQNMTAESFVRFMEAIWDMHGSPLPNGGMTIQQHPDYEKYHHARRTAQLAGFHYVRGSRLGDEPAQAWKAPGGGSVIIATHGGAIRATRRTIRQQA